MKKKPHGMVTLLLGAAALLASNASSAALYTLQPLDGKDTQLVGDISSSENFGSYSYLVTNWSGNSRSVGLLEFDLTGISGPASSASLDLFHHYNYNLGQTYNIYRITSAWDESAVTMDTAPMYDPVAVAALTIGDGTQGVHRNWDVTSLVNGWLTGAYANYGMWIEDASSGMDATAYFASSDYPDDTAAPKLTINTRGGTVPEPSAIALLGIGLLGMGLSRSRKSRT